ncbi:LysM peptidoglycan-binding domain-containing protein [Agromyces lapidis]|uniref:LysM peptidoglycan-binding domain-containing protein n=1 Tax=Agromyces lapidis TaxID=279574 RepID=A0ABV5SQE4_9MICO|nr:LysM peptidoglycan-binding domain-containing protein [Agromyces lapidis]
MSAAIMTGGYAPVQTRPVSTRPGRLREPDRVARAGAVDEAAVRTRLRLTRRGRVVFTTLAGLPLIVWAFVVVLGAGGAAADVSGADAGAALEYVTVDAGGSLWEIAESIAPTADPRDTIAEILRINGLDEATIVPGQRLAVPAGE